MSYLLANARDAARVRLDAIAEIFDPWTFAHLAALGLAPGWRCWEVGAGGPTVAAWIGERVGASGRVIATDLDVTWVTAAASDHVEVRVHDVARDAPPGDGFDLIHARLVLVHVPARDEALRTLVGALRPGGWLVIEDADPGLQPLACLEEPTAEHALANRLRREFRALLAERGAQLAYGRTLPGALARAGLEDVRAEAFFAVTHPAHAALERGTIEHVRELLVGAGRATAEELDRHLAAVAAGRVEPVTAPLVSAWGRRPAS